MSIEAMTDHTEELHQRIAALEAENERLHERNDSLASDFALCATEREKFRAELAALKTQQEGRQAKYREWFSEMVGEPFESWLNDDFTHWISDEDAAYQAWQYLHENKIYPLTLELEEHRKPGPDVRALAASLYQACGAYDMPGRILDVLSAAANGEPFTHMIDGLLPCVPPSGECVRSLVEALREVAASLAWNCFGECRAVHDGPIMPAAGALEMARTALATYHQDTQPCPTP